MTLGEFFNVLSDNPAIIVFYFVAVPLTALLALFLGRGHGHLSPWKYLYATLVYLACVPGIFALSLSFYLFLFEHRSIMDTNIYTQILPLISMVLTIWLIRRNVDLDLVPGFGKLSGLIILILVILTVMWVLDRTRIFALTYFPLVYALLILVALFVLARFALRKITR